MIYKHIYIVLRSFWKFKKRVFQLYWLYRDGGFVSIKYIEIMCGTNEACHMTYLIGLNEALKIGFFRSIWNEIK